MAGSRGTVPRVVDQQLTRLPRWLEVSMIHSAGAVRSLSSMSQAWPIVWKALWLMRNGRFDERIP